jgi:hypothetical protein
MQRQLVKRYNQPEHRTADVGGPAAIGDLDTDRAEHLSVVAGNLRADHGGRRHAVDRVELGDVL